MIIGVDTDRETYMELLEQNRKLRYERLMAKAAFFSHPFSVYHMLYIKNKDVGEYITQCDRIAAAYEARAAKLKENK